MKAWGLGFRVKGLGFGVGLGCRMRGVSSEHGMCCWGVFRQRRIRLSCTRGSSSRKHRGLATLRPSQYLEGHGDLVSRERVINPLSPHDPPSS